MIATAKATARSDAQGFHRYAAAQAAALETFACEVRPGSLRDAILHSAGTNA